ncbi:hypothetical protein FEM21_18820 [Flavobacterium seoulense]|uniref:Uncharacterized protein n=1 Tax=Flavobacterium seoulense TaxID=1492738 RepID=A0A066WLJ5_9FLAO|nr:hypothetical protein FEM21_18820 [Flavobacterium seoulense]
MKKNVLTKFFMVYLGYVLNLGILGYPNLELKFSLVNKTSSTT